MNAQEWRSVFALGALYALRMLGMFMVLPVFALYARDLPEPAQPWQIGMAIGIYGLTQAILQIPAGMLSDRYGRKPVIMVGMLIFALGSYVAGASDNINWIIAGRAIQGGGAISGVVAALLADVTRDSVRTTAMAILGAGMGLAFVLALVLGPLVSGWIGVNGIFWLTGVLALLALPLLIWGVPTPRAPQSRDGDLRTVLANPTLLRLDAGIFLLHACMTAVFTIVPLAIAQTLGWDGSEHWKLYLPVLIVSLIPVFPLIRRAEKGGRFKVIFLGAIGALALALMLAAAGYRTPTGLVLAMLLYFTAFNFLEGALPSLISRAAPPAQKGAALGAYSSAQFLGSFTGGALAGLALQFGGIGGGFAVLTSLPVLWLMVATGQTFIHSAHAKPSAITE
ncbi:MFS transporter [Sinimarinibacterium sp. NLF-5-8]|uniref:MFS transporter n=1 Tax=Sinimarinibacterium sp. NLF-5-8 TaxID=2698684 RepID=UPI00137B96DB|nr:MFS transporter [Sinimarinibacterium sp. NLF-5-8]QHS11201.1 MFS transporter [Sinimarinibacterium sp. NLF-5-8]